MDYDDVVENTRETLNSYRVSQLRELCRESGVSQCAKNKMILVNRLLPIVLKEAGYVVVNIPETKKKFKKKKVEEKKVEENDIEIGESSDIEESSDDESSITEPEN